MNKKIAMGTLYDVNKSIILQKEKPLSSEELANKLSEMKKFCLAKNNKYYMLLNKEKSDYTLFNTSSEMNVAKKSMILSRIIYDDLRECLQNRGKILSIEITEMKDAYEIWLLIDKEAYVYYFFCYDSGVIEEGI